MTIFQLLSGPFWTHEPMLGWECAYICHNFRTEKEGIDKINREDVKQTIGIQVTLILEIKPQKYIS